MRAVTRNRGHRVLFVLDEFSSLGYIREVETAINTFSGYGLTVWPVLTSLGALKRHYPDSWENFLANAAVRHFTGIQDEFTASYVSSMIGDTTFVTTEGRKGEEQYQATPRRLLTPDEVRRGSANHIFTFIEQRPPIDFEKRPYYDMPDMVGRYDANPYYTGE